MLAVPEVRAFVPLLKVCDMAAAIAFYEKLGFALSNSFTPEGHHGPQWALLTAGSVEVMLGLGDQAGPSDEFYLYCGDVEQMHAKARESGLAPTEIRKPFFNPGGEFDFTDPDGRVIHIA
jgi:predicted lactoylglutathione lyase